MKKENNKKPLNFDILKKDAIPKLDDGVKARLDNYFELKHSNKKVTQKSGLAFFTDLFTWPKSRLDFALRFAGGALTLALLIGGLNLESLNDPIHTGGKIHYADSAEGIKDTVHIEDISIKF